MSCLVEGDRIPDSSLATNTSLLESRGHFEDTKDKTHHHLQTSAMTHGQTTASLTDMFLSVPLEQKEMPFYYLGKCARLVCVCKQKL